MEYKVSEVVKIISGGTPKRKNSEYWNGDIPWLSVKDFNNNFRLVNNTEEYITESGLNNSAATLVNKGTVVISARGTVGALCQVSKKMTFNQSCFGLEAIKDFTNNEYIYYWLKYKTNYIRSNTHGSVFDTINRKTFDNLYINLPSSSYQEKVVNILTSIDDKLELNQKIIANLEELSQTLFKRWFVDFEFPDENGNPYKSSGGEMVDSELGEIPKEWEIMKFGTLASIRTGFAFKSKEYIEKIQLPVVRSLNISKSNLLITMNDVKFVPYEYTTIDKYKKYQLDIFDTLLVTVGGSIGNIGLITENNIPSLQNQNMWRFRSNNDEISNIFIYQLVVYVNSFVRNQTSGSAREFYTKRTFENFKLLLPKLDSYLYEKINVHLGFFGEKISNLHVEIENLTQLRDTLLPKLMSGELEIPDDIEVNDDDFSI